MSRHHAHRPDSSIEVRLRDGEPSHFLWRGRLYRVVEVLERWRRSGAWWESPVAMGAVAAAVGELDLAPVPASPKWAQRAWGEPAPDLGAAAGPVVLDDVERAYWRVEAGRGASSGTGIYDLCHDAATSHWSLSMVVD